MYKKRARRGLERLDEGNAEREVLLAWENLEDVPVFFANQFICQFTQDEFVVSIGQMVPPAVLGEPGQQEQIDRIPVRALARIAFTHQRLVELINVLQANREQYEQAQRARNEQMGGDGT
jgi:hypothetical protein